MTRWYSPAELGSLPQTWDEQAAVEWRAFEAGLVAFMGEWSPRMQAVGNEEWRDIVNGLADVLSDASHYAETAEQAAKESAE